MKKRIIRFSLLLMAISVTAFSFINKDQPKEDVLTKVTEVNQDQKNYPEFDYDIGPRFRGVKKEELEQAKSIGDFLPEEPIDAVVSYKSVKVIIVKNERPTNIVEVGFSDELTIGQKELLRSSDISTSFSIRADYMGEDTETGELKVKWFNPYLTIVPETQAEYVQGKDELLSYLIENSKEARRIVKMGDNVRPAKLFFTVTKNGSISNVNIGNHSGFPSLDKKMIQLVEKIPGKWIPAQNSRGEMVDQELVFSYTLAGGC